MNEATKDELIDIASRMAQELQDFIDEAEQSGCENPFPGTRTLIDEWEAIYKRTHLCWQQKILNDDAPSGLLNL